MVIWEEAVYDRLQSDVDLVKKYMEIGWSNLSDDQKTTWLEGMKGAFNSDDAKRINNNIKIISDTLELDLAVDEEYQYPNDAFFSNIITNVETIRNAYCIHSDTPQTPEKPVNAYQQINDIERILSDVYEIIMSNFSYYAGMEIYAGDTFGLLL